MDFRQVMQQYLALRLTNRTRETSLAHVLGGTSIDLIPYQLEAAQFADHAIKEHGGAILAEEVGLGKTIEAGIVISQHWHERKQKILVITPASLIEQWCRELSEKFHLPVMTIDTKSFRQTGKAHRPSLMENKIIICSFHIARNLAEIIREVPWNLAVIDEVHNLRNYDGKISTSIRRSLKTLPKLLITGTPLQNSPDEILSLLSFIDDYLPESYVQAQLNLHGKKLDVLQSLVKPIMHRTLRKDSMLNFPARIANTVQFQPHAEEQALYTAMDSYLLRPNLYALPEAQRSLIRMTLRKLLASSSFTLRHSLATLITRLETAIKIQAEIPLPTPDMSEAEIEDIDALWSRKVRSGRKLSRNELSELQEELDLLRELHRQAEVINVNAKGDALLKILSPALDQTRALGGSRKAVIFTGYLKTQEYLQRILEDSTFAEKTVIINGTNQGHQATQIYREWAVRNRNTEHYHGNQSIDRKTALLDYFQDHAEILIATEAAAEGLNLQFCSLVINYDLPWNPQRIEQRIGRCHRYGQKSDVVVVNFLEQHNYAETRLLQLLDKKLKLFNNFLGASNKVIGGITDKVNFEEWVYQLFQDCRSREDIEQHFARQEELLDQCRQETSELYLPSLNVNIREQLLADTDRIKDEITKGRAYIQRLLALHGRYNVDIETLDFNHPHVQNILEKSRHPELGECAFNVKFRAPSREHPLSSLSGKSGWMVLWNITMETTAPLDYLVAVGFTDEGMVPIEIPLDLMLDLPIDSVQQEESLQWMNHVTTFFPEDNAGTAECINDKLSEWRAKKLSLLTTEQKHSSEAEIVRMRQKLITWRGARSKLMRGPLDFHFDRSKKADSSELDRLAFERAWEDFRHENINFERQQRRLAHEIVQVHLPRITDDRLWAQVRWEISPRKGQRWG